MAKKKEKKEEGKDAPAWLTTFGDLMALLLTFFVLLLSFSSVHEDKFRNAIGSLQGALGVLSGQPLLTSPVRLHKPVIRGPKKVPAKHMKRAAAEVQKAAEEAGRQGDISVVETSEGFMIRISSPILFSLGKADVLSDGQPVFSKIADILSGLPNRIEIEGHTDNLPIHNEEFSSNWALSSARAVNVLHFFERRGLHPRRLYATGRAEYAPLVPNDSPEHRSINRRVEIHVRYEKEQDAAAEKVHRLLGGAGIGTGAPR